MNIMETKRQKAQSVSKKWLLMLLFFCACFYSFSQRIIEGKFLVSSSWYRFHSNNTFEYAKTGELGVYRYGKGHYTIMNDSLILNFDLTDVKYTGYHIIKSYQNLKDSVNIRVSVCDLDRNQLSDVQVFMHNAQGKSSMNTDERGLSKLSVKKEDKISYLTIIHNYECMHQIPNIHLSLSYEIEVYLTKIPFMEPFERWYAIKDVVKKFKIRKFREDYIELKDIKGNVLKLEKVKENYVNDPFN